MAKIYAYIRVSTQYQNLEKDHLDVLTYANRLGIGPVVFEEEKISGTVPWRKRKVALIIDKLEKGDILIEPEMSRLGRNAIELYQMVEVIESKGAILHLVKERMVYDPESPMSKLMLGIFASFATFELTMLKERTKAGLRKAREEGKQLGRPKGSSKSKLDKLETKIRDELAAGVKKKRIAQNLGCSESTLHEWIKKKGL